MVELRGEVTRRVPCLPDGPGLLIRTGVWAQQEYTTADSALLVLASEPYDPDSYILTPPTGSEDTAP